MKLGGYLRVILALFLFGFASTSVAALPSMRTIYFGGVRGFTYYPASMEVIVGDTIRFVGNFSQLPLQTISLPSAALPFGPVNVGDTFYYLVQAEGTYIYQNPQYAPIGMRGSFHASKPQLGLTNDGREFFLGMLYPSYNFVSGAYVKPDFRVFALLSTYYDNDVSVSYFNSNGTETTPQKYHITKGSSLKLPLLVSMMQMDTASDVTAYRSCHIRSTYPLTVYYISLGVCSGGSYLALPLMGLGKKYVAASFNDNPGNGALIGTVNTSGYLPTQLDYAGGEVLVIGTEPETVVKITPTCTTSTGHVALRPYTISLSRGECYLVRSPGQNEDCDLSGTTIEASRPVSVISGHENAALGGVDPYSLEARDFMIEQMTPVEFWDSTGFISVPLPEPTPAPTEGVGDTYRIYVSGGSAAKTHVDVVGVSGGYDLSARGLTAPPQLSGIDEPVEINATDGKKIAVMQYDERSQLGQQGPWPCPSMMTVVPKSRWKTSYFFSMPGRTNEEQTSLTAIFVNVISPDISGIKVKINGGPVKSLSTIDRFANFTNVSKTYPELKGSQYLFIANYPAYQFFSDDPFMVYYSCTQYFQPDPTHGQSDYANFYDEYASPAGMQLNTGTTPHFAIDTQLSCAGWHICVRDTGANDPGIKAVMLVDDPDGVYFQVPNARPLNVALDSLSNNFSHGDLIPAWHSNANYCFDVKIRDHLSPSDATVAIVDNFGNIQILHLTGSAPSLKIITQPFSGNDDSLAFPLDKIGDTVRATVTIKNLANVGATALEIDSVSFMKHYPEFLVNALSVPLPFRIQPGDSLTIQISFTARDSNRLIDSLVIHSTCSSIFITLNARGASGLIDARDMNFSVVNINDTLCKDVTLRNVGTAPLTLSSNYSIINPENFSIAPKSASLFPLRLDPGASKKIGICFHPTSKGTFVGKIIWDNDLFDYFKHSVKDFSDLTGTAVPLAGVEMQMPDNELTIYPNPSRSGFTRITIPSRFSGLAILEIYDVLGREVYHRQLSEGEKNITVPTRNLPDGMYSVRVTNNREVLSVQFEIVKL
ncbi:MAG: choice-of-anchor D domain-containing protein [bacterium]